MCGKSLVLSKEGSQCEGLVLAAHAGRPQLNQQNPGLKRNLVALGWAFHLHTGAEEEGGSVGLLVSHSGLLREPQFETKVDWRR